MKEKIVFDNAISLYTESFGDPTHEPIILIMGAMSSAVWWPSEFCSQLAAMNHYVIRYDHRDTGQSTSYEPGKAPYSVEELALWSTPLATALLVVWKSKVCWSAMPRTPG